MKQIIATIASVAALTAFAAEPTKAPATTPAPVTAPAKKEVAKQADTKSVAPAAAKTEAPKK